ncbi:hypothetical protein DEM27_33195 [Metarhizobium album]|uniref:HTH araC/xylS-type domain-containing protein n=1 Tax=Metarhizobium album TaxID=2182425 RepID=A0A2U2DFG9_9HYPH|nr:helix-turn-helix domain-containing protein [Rhizobium album]PWE52040.1 hypothetical protein DEM27_33195 [Rhizobium album]
MVALASGTSSRSHTSSHQIKIATVMLGQSGLPMCHIAAECGFSGTAHFTRQFRAAKGLPPMRYRREFKSSAAGGYAGP